MEFFARSFTSYLVLLAAAGWITYVSPSHAETASAASDKRLKLFVSSDQPLRSGIWRYRALQGGASSRCSGSHGDATTFAVVVDNESDEPLDCSISLTLSRKQLDEDVKQIYENIAVIEPRRRQQGLSVCTITNETFEIATADCRVRQPPLPWRVPDGCTYAIVRDTELEYPPASVRRAEQAPVYVSFSIREAEGRPMDIAIAASSGFARLDEAALRYVKRTVMRTSCPGVQHRMRISFQLDEFGHPMERQMGLPVSSRSP
jgi:TonB family protein